MNIRPATADDYGDLIRMGEQFYQETEYAEFAPFHADSAGLLFDLMLESGVLLVAEHEDGTIVGMVGLLVMPFMFNHSRKSAHEVLWWVDPEWRGTSAGPMLMDAVIPACAAQGAGAVVMAHLPSSPHSVGRVYERLGFRLSETAYTKVL